MALFENMNCRFWCVGFSILVGVIIVLPLSGTSRFCRSSPYVGIGMPSVWVPVGLKWFVWGRLSWQFWSGIWRWAWKGASRVFVG